MQNDLIYHVINFNRYCSEYFMIITIDSNAIMLNNESIKEVKYFFLLIVFFGLLLCR